MFSHTNIIPNLGTTNLAKKYDFLVSQLNFYVLRYTYLD